MNSALTGWVRWPSLRVAIAVDLVVLTAWSLVVVLGELETAGALIALTLVLVPTTYAALCCNETGARQWAVERGADLGPAWTPVMYRYLLRSRVARALGVTLGLAVPSMAVARFNVAPERFPDFTTTWLPLLNPYWLLVLGYVVGSVIAEATKPRLQDNSGSANAVLSRRHLGDFLDPRVERAGWFFAALGLVAIVVVAVWAPPLGDDFRHWAFLHDRRTRWEFVRAVMAAGVALLALASAWWICRRREVASNDKQLAYEELTRAASANALVGAAIAASAEFSMGLISLRTRAAFGPGSTGWWLSMPLLLVSIVGLGIWIGCGTKLVFSNRRIDRFRAAAART